MTSSGDAPDAPSGPSADPVGTDHDDDGPDADDAGEPAPGEAAGAPVARRRRRRRRRRGENDGANPQGKRGAGGSQAAPGPEQTAGSGSAPARDAGGSPAQASQAPSGGRHDERGNRHDERGGRHDDAGARREERTGRHDDAGARREERTGRRGRRRHGEPRPGQSQQAAEPAAKPPQGRDARPRGHDPDRRAAEPDRRAAEPEAPERRSREDQDDRRGREAPERYALLSSTFEGPTTRLDPRRPVAPTDDLDLEGTTTPAIPWGKDDDGPPAEVALAADLPPDAPDDDADPLTHPLLELPSAPLGDDIANVAGVRFVPGGRVQWCDVGDADYGAGERVMVESDRGTRLAQVAVPPSRRPVRERSLRRVVRRANEHDLRGERDGDADRAQALRVAKDRAAALRLPLKVFRVDVLGQLGRGARLNVYYTTDERLDLRDFLREVSSATGGGRVELRQLGVRDEAKAVGGIGSCGLTLCCTTWLPDFVPVSIKMAKDQGLVLSPTKVSGQCGRLKCCLVYEQAAYAELRKGLPKLGKRVIAARGEGRVVEVDVLRQRIRVSYGPGDTEVVPADKVRPLFPSGNQPVMREAEPEAPDTDDEPGDLDMDLPDAVPDSLDGMTEPGLDAMSDAGLDAASDEIGDDPPEPPRDARDGPADDDPSSAS
jgi:cell fate regulator YaaT (PSP1 superfamily)